MSPEPEVKSIEKVASGGELARVMLALKAAIEAMEKATTQAELDKAATELEETNKTIVDLSKLNYQLAEAEKHVQTNYTAGTWYEFAKALEAAKTGLINGTIHVFDINNFTVNGAKLTEDHLADVAPDDAYTPDTKVVYDGYFHESEKRSAPYFDLRIDGIKLVNEKY